jgi:sulfur-oxidizing protein SoxZ
MARETKIRTRNADGGTEIMVLVKHPMETGLRKEAGAIVPAHFIQEITVAHNGKVVATAQMGIGVSKDPLLSFVIAGAKNGDKIKMTWKDNKGESGSAEEKVEL